MNSSQPGERVTTTTIATRTTIVERTAIATARDSLEPRAVTPPRIRELRLLVSAWLFQVGRAGLREIRVLELLDHVPFAQRRLSARFTQLRSSCAFWSTSPKRSFVPLVGSFPTITPSSTCTAVT